MLLCLCWELILAKLSTISAKCKTFEQKKWVAMSKNEFAVRPVRRVWVRGSTKDREFKELREFSELRESPVCTILKLPKLFNLPNDSTPQSHIVTPVTRVTHPHTPVTPVTPVTSVTLLLYLPSLHCRANRTSRGVSTNCGKIDVQILDISC